MNTFAYISGVESRTQDSRPRTQKKSEAKDSLSEDRPSRGQGQECSRSTTQAHVFSKKSLQSFFSGDLKKRSSKIFLKILTIKKKIVLSSSRGQGNFRGLDLRGQGLQNVSSRTLPPLIMSKRMMSRL